MNKDIVQDERRNGRSDILVRKTKANNEQKSLARIKGKQMQIAEFARYRLVRNMEENSHFFQDFALSSNDRFCRYFFPRRMDEMQRELGHFLINS